MTMTDAPPITSRPALITPNGGVRCWSCGRRNLNTVTAPYDFDCRCGAKNKDDRSIA